MNKKWELNEANDALINKISEEFNVSKLVANIIANKGLTNSDEIEVFLHPRRTDFHDPFMMPDMEKAVDRVVKAIETHEKVAIYGDYDVDGITSITVLKSFLKDVGLDVDYYIPNRLEEGYGLNKNAIDEIANMAFLMNEQTENIGARRLHTILEKLLEDISFNVPDVEDKHIIIDSEYVKQKFEEKIHPEDLDRYILKEDSSRRFMRL